MGRGPLQGPPPQHVSQLGAERLSTKASSRRASPRSHDPPVPTGLSTCPELVLGTSCGSLVPPPHSLLLQMPPHTSGRLWNGTHIPLLRGRAPTLMVHGQTLIVLPSHTSLYRPSLGEGLPPLHASPELLSLVSAEQAGTVPVMGNPPARAGVRRSRGLLHVPPPLALRRITHIYLTELMPIRADAGAVGGSQCVRGVCGSGPYSNHTLAGLTDLGWSARRESSH